MRLEAKSRLVATEVTAGTGDAKSIRDVFLKFFPKMKLADGLFKDSAKAGDDDDGSGSDLLEEANSEFDQFQIGLEVALERLMKSKGLKVEIGSDAGVGSHDIYGGLSMSGTGIDFEFSYSLDYNDMRGHDIGLTFGKKEFTFKWAAGRLDQAKYEKFINSAIDYFEKNGFGGPGSAKPV